MVYACYFVVLSEAYVALVAASIAAQGGCGVYLFLCKFASLSVVCSCVFFCSYKR
ncbi:hypothetical protein ANAPC1_00436 [Anaplasma phagocytophilum]|uniref:Uncharacterized protein n=1 Tax=Anaplasma phagocytophilum TaxID=948 RepID=A0AA45USH3_ANAPH|nr:hypothetical protein ANAPC1_00436 [Anaplasma phagocytophilum]SBO29977.1 hypothetical protein ANAPC3_00055 [Anaplasma phagocytophilum]SBO30734.1 hypothetical protein ANAPC4_00280 [Anaplasma phagocytophilum]SBO30929.1 hypothetical protein ANAPC4_00335 [Anaplasma phagocytophilum]SBO31229.1 hypothetical protein ANAPC2_00562 [Anaplasma phagocytophilum]